MVLSISRNHRFHLLKELAVLQLPVPVNTGRPTFSMLTLSRFAREHKAAREDDSSMYDSA